MATYCDLDISRKIEARNHYRFAVRLLLKNPSDQRTRIKWRISVPTHFVVVQPSMPINGETILEPRAEEHVAGWTIDVSRVPQQQLAEIARLHPLIATLDQIETGGGMTGDICSRRLIQSD